jgi:colicin import membrane protein
MFAAGLILAGCCASGIAVATLPPPSPSQAAAAAAKKAEADAQAQKEKEELLATMDALAARWRARAATLGKPVHPPVPVTTQTAAVSTPATGAASQVPAPVRSEKAGTAAPSADVKKGPSQPQPAGTPPTVNNKPTANTK